VALLTKQMRMECSRCGRVELYRFVLRCARCQGLLDPVYDLSAVQFRDSPSPLERYFDLVPLESSESILYIGEGNTPCVRADALGQRFGLPFLYLKNETANVTLTTKDRMAACVISQFAELGIKEFVASSTGNSSTSFAYALGWREDITAHLFTGTDFVSRHGYHHYPNVELHVIEGDFMMAGIAAKQFAHEKGIPFEGGFFNAARREGLKLAYLEAFDQMPAQPTVVIQAVSSGMGVYGAYRGACAYRELGRLERMPRFVCVQQESCAPMCMAFKEDSALIKERHIVSQPTGIAKAILRGDPSASYPYLYRIVRSSNGTFVSVTAEQIMAARHHVLADTGIGVSYEAAAAVAAIPLLASDGWLDSSDVVLVNLTGGSNGSTAAELSAPGVGAYAVTATEKDSQVR
jgi:threonine synthase